MKIGVVILSRFSSNRLPGKALMEIGGKPILQYIIERISQVVDTEKIVIATSVENSDDKIEQFAQKTGINCFRGSLDNVAERFFEAGKNKKWDYIVRINGDNIFLDINILKDMITIAKTGKYDFITNVKDRTFPKGMSIEILKLSYFESLLLQINKEEKYKEHVTLYAYDYPSGNNFYYMNSLLPEASGIQMALDTKEDFERTEQIIQLFNGDHFNYNLYEIYNIWKEIQK
ncbi:MAG: hypothetical protein RSE15_10955 [Flavobacterium sp.]|jgi:spore coat polysaccharide biosynthesis protein SpsF|uniref:cytidylyltransferase domain-containing protein n=1 Tax=Flavobacterium sp. TaxID=239 RepID=UPI002974960F|nr:NTP transferase domain-containing protein [Flavobacterium sp.]TAF09699.1 MAG: hypothetical protein EAZ75_07180 [Flavobacteriia bacterium]WRH72869.1 MAG: hypothetical protein RSE15_10955 [Flavobacterium sp.]